MRGKGQRRRAWRGAKATSLANAEGGEAGDRPARRDLRRAPARSSHRRRSCTLHIALVISAPIARAPGDGSRQSRSLSRRRASTSRLRQAALGGVSKHHVGHVRPPRLCVQAAALVCALFGGTADGRARDLGADRASARRRVTTIAQLVAKTGIDLRAAAAASRDGELADAAIAAASCARPRTRRGFPCATCGRGTACMRASQGSAASTTASALSSMVGRDGRVVVGANGEAAA
jgi:hypothetical protein